MPSLEVKVGDAESSSFRYYTNGDLGDTEDLEKYEKGGFHPVHLGDVFDGRYRVVHKLGAGGFSTIWLARDDGAEKWVALKIVVAAHSAVMETKTLHVCEATPLAGQHHFFVDGPNGRHICLVLPVLGPSGSRMSQHLQCRMRPPFAGKASHQATVALAGLHARSICHGDATTANIVFSISDLERYSESEIYRLFGDPVTASLETESGENPEPEAPRYIVKTLDFLSAPENLIREAVDLIDFDLSFPSSAPPTEMLGTPVEFLAPEVCVGRQAGPASDVWAMGCSIFRLRAGYGPFSHFECWSPCNVLSFIAETLGDPPDSWQPIIFDADGQPTTDPAQGDAFGETAAGISLRAMIDKIYDEPPDRQVMSGNRWEESRIFHEGEDKPFAPQFNDMVWKPTAVKIDNIYLYGYDDQTASLLEVMPKISKQEADLLYDLLSKIFVYDPEQRISAAEMISHPWFHMDQAEAVDPPMGVAS